MRKYERFQVVNDEGTTDFEKYRKAFSAYQKSESPATLYGITLEGDFNLIASKAD